MFKKTFLSLAVASAVTLSGCGGNGGGNANAGAQNEFDGDLPDSLEGQFEGKVWPLFNPIASLVPVPNDLLLDQTAADGTFSDSTANSVLAALGSLSGASTIAPIDIPFSGMLNGDSLSAAPFISSGGSPVPNPNQNVFLLELAYASGEPIQGLTISEPPTIPLAAGVLLAKAQSDSATAAAILGAAIADAPAIKASVIELSNASTLRIQPTKPLKPKTRYLVIVTNEVEDATGQPISMDPNYYLLTGSGNLPSSQLEPVRTIINSFWERTAASYFALNNSTRSNLGKDPLTVNNIALTYSFTTSGDEKVMEYIANPSEWFNDQITSFIRISAAKKVLTSTPTADYSAIKSAADAAVAAFPTTEQIAAFSPIFDSGYPCFGANGATAIGCASSVLTANFSSLLPTPKARELNYTSSNTPVNLVSALTSSLLTTTNSINPLVSQGTISTPYYLGIPTSVDGSTIQSSTWTANKPLADALNLAFSSAGLKLPQGDSKDDNGNPVAAKSTVVNYVFPFPTQADANTATPDTADPLPIPWLAIYPDNTTACPKPLKTVIFQHGITTDRSAALSVGTVLAENCFATIAIDQVVHGVAPASTEKKQGLAATFLQAAQEASPPLPSDWGPTSTNIQHVLDAKITLEFVKQEASLDEDSAKALIQQVLSGVKSGKDALDAGILALTSIENTVANAGSTIPGIAHTSNERHFDYTANAAQQAVAMNFDPASASGSSGSLFINLTGFINSRDKNRQGVIDQLNLRQTISSIDLDGPDGGLYAPGDLDNNNVFFMGHSLGTLIGTPFVAVANSTPMDNIKAAALLTPASGIVRMLENSPSFAPTIIGGLSAAGIDQKTTSYETFLGVFQAALDAVDPISFADNLNTSVNYSGNYQTSADDTGVLMIELAGRPDVNGNAQIGYVSDQTNVIETETTQLTTSFGTPYPDLLSGVDKLAQQMGATNTLDAASPSGSPDTLISRLSYGSHAMYVLPIVSSSEASSYPDAAAETARRKASFAEGLTESITFFTLGGEISSAAVDTTAALAGETTGLETEADYQARTNKQLNLSN
ncbi:hypothetical protein EUZ85_10500 [Hahella sp. KA22]|uniref:Ig-like domain-containing protein n=1 Tax=Hahella sp. KA22 TaxID=1628392 RepID=UPI000FDDC05E|nr:Ig-like domain-containing protein [Hahella sp. KA22]AZZ91134.1 hypothetical protein ENC22_07945 [Hahella sp. KA22]QAY54502.1 hypothetical protein EUZ85_10500 [Hahella sp. KA22]